MGSSRYKNWKPLPNRKHALLFRRWMKKIIFVVVTLLIVIKTWNNFLKSLSSENVLWGCINQHFDHIIHIDFFRFVESCLYFAGLNEMPNSCPLKPGLYQWRKRDSFGWSSRCCWPIFWKMSAISTYASTKC